MRLFSFGKLFGCFQCYYQCCFGLCVDHRRQQQNSFRSSVVRKFKPTAPPTGCGILAQPNRNLKNTFRVHDLLVKPYTVCLCWTFKGSVKSHVSAETLELNVTHLSNNSIVSVGLCVRIAITIPGSFCIKVMQ